MASLATFPHATLRAFLDRLVPPDEFAGAVDAGVENYLLRQLAGDCAPEAASLTQGLIQLDFEAAARHRGNSFTTLAAEQQDALLRDLEAGKPATIWPDKLSAGAFFARMVDLAHEGFYADPGNGGNRDMVSWRMIGYDPRLPRHLANDRVSSLDSQTSAPPPSASSLSENPHPGSFGK